MAIQTRTLKEYMSNPSGNKASVMTNRQMYEDLYQGKWGEIMTRENGHIEYKLYHSKNVYVAYMKIPSEVIEDFYYDVVFKLTLKDSSRTLENAIVQFFSNDPAFNYTWAYAFNKHGLCIKELEKRMSKTALRLPPKEKNPDKTVGYVKSLYFGYIYLRSKGLLNKLRFETESEKLDWKLLTKLIRDTDEVVKAREEAGAKAAASKKKSKDVDNTQLRKEDIKHPEIHSNNQAIRRVNFIGNMNTVKKAGTVHKHNGVKRTKKIGGRR